MKNNTCVYCGKTAFCADKESKLICFNRAYDGKCLKEKIIINPKNHTQNENQNNTQG